MFDVSQLLQETEHSQHGVGPKEGTEWHTDVVQQLQHLEQIWLVVWTPLKNISQLGWLFQIYGKIKLMFQTTNQKWFKIV